MFLDFVYEYVEIIPRSRHISSENYLSCLDIKSRILTISSFMSKPSVEKSFHVRHPSIHGGYASAQCKMLLSILQEIITSTFD